jgi:ATP-binding cassette subfamily B protein
VAGLILALPFEIAITGLIPLSIRFIADRVIGAGPAPLYIAATFLGAGLVAALIAGVVREFLSSRLVSGLLLELRQSMFDRLQRLPILPNARDRTSELVERFSEDLAQVENMVSMAIPVFFVPGVQALFCSALIFWLDWRVGIVALALWPWNLLAPRAAGALAARNRLGLAEEEKHLLSVVKESIDAQPFVRAFALEPLRGASFRKRNHALTRNAARAGLVPALLERFAGGGMLFLLVAIACVSAAIASTDTATMSAGSLVAIQMLAVAICNSLYSMNEFIPVYSAGTAANGRIQETLDEYDSVADAQDARVLPPIASELGFADVRFAYTPEGEKTKWQLAGITARIPKGAYVAFVGPSGCGKTTLLKLLLRFYDPHHGLISIDGHDLKAVSQASLRAQIGVVFQENHIFSASIRDNILVAKPDSSEEAIVSAAEAIGLDAMVRELPQGYATMTGERGAALSVAGIQRLAIARALLRSPEILVLDEATSGLEPGDEKQINDLLVPLRAGRTVIALTHRLATVADADYIFMMDNGEIVERGSHYELMAANGVYAGYWRKQAGFTFSADGKHVDVDAERLQAFPILEKLDYETLAQLAPFFTTETFPPGREIVRQNDSGDRFYIIARGKVEVWRTEEVSGQSSAIAVLQDGDFFGEITLISGFPRTATVRTATVCTCISLERGHFNRLLEHNPALQRQLSEVAVQRLRETSKALPAEAGLSALSIQ